MRKYIFIILVLTVFFAEAQNEGDVPQVDSNSKVLSNIATYGWDGGTSKFINPQKNIKGSVYLFDNWDNYSAIYLKNTDKKYLLKNFNINIQSNTFESQIARDSIYTFNLNNIDKLVINNITYKNVYSDEGKRIYKVIYESDTFGILEGYSITLVSGSPNPMLNRSGDKFVRNSSYYVKRENSIQPFKLKKSKIMDLLSSNPDKAAKVEKFMSDNNLSYKKTEDLKKALEYSDK